MSEKIKRFQHFFIDGSKANAQFIFSGLVHVANLTPSSGTETSFVGIYASSSPGKTD
jgi:hypothetical protein